MTDITPAPQVRRIAALALTLIPALVLVMVAAPAVSGYLDHRDHMATLTRDAMSYRAAIAAMPAEQAALARLKQSPELNDIVLQAPQASVAAAELQERISQLATGAGTRVIQSATQIKAGDGGLTELGAHVVIEGDIAALSRFLHALETARPLVMIRRVVINDPDGDWQEQQTQTPGQPMGPNQLQAQLDLSGFMRPS